MSREAAVRMVLARTVLRVTIWALTVYLRWKRSKGLGTKARAPAGDHCIILRRSMRTLGIKDNMKKPSWTQRLMASSLCPPCPH